MRIHPVWAVLTAIVVGGGLAWWMSRDTPDQARAKRERAEHAAAARAEDARPVLYRWHNGNGVLQITEQPPQGKDAGRLYQRIDKTPQDGIQVRGDRP